METQEVQYGYFSVKASVQHGTFIYMTPDGKEITVTSISKFADPKESGYLWDDAKNVGEVTTFVRRGLDGSMSYVTKPAFDPGPKTRRCNGDLAAYGRLFRPTTRT